MKFVYAALAMGLAFSVQAKEWVEKKDVLAGYEQRCHAVLPQKGYSPEETQKACDCQLQVVDQNYDKLAFIREMGMKKQQGLPISSEEAEKLKSASVGVKSKLAVCRKPS